MTYCHIMMLNLIEVKLGGGEASPLSPHPNWMHPCTYWILLLILCLFSPSPSLSLLFAHSLSLSVSLSLTLSLSLSFQVSLPLPSLVSVPLVSLVTPWGEPQHWECWVSIPPYLPLASLDYPPTFLAWEIHLQDQQW